MKALEFAFALKGKLDTSLTKSFDNVNKRLNNIQNSFSQTALEKSKLDEVFAKRQSTLQASQELAKNKIALEALQKEIKTTGANKKELQAKILKTVEAVKKSEQAYLKQKKALEEVEKNANTTGKSVKELTKAHEQLTNQLEKQQKATQRLKTLENANSKIDNIASKGGEYQTNGAIKAGKSVALATAIYAKPLKDAMELEDQQAELGKFSDIADEIIELNKELAQSYAISTESMMQMQTAAMQSNILDPNKINEIKQYTLTSAKAMVALGLDADIVGESFSNIKNKIDGTLEGTTKAFDLVNQLSNSTSASAADILEVLNRTGGAVKALTGMQTEQVVALSTAFRSASVSAEVAATAQGAFINVLTIGANATKGQQEGFKKLGIDAIKLSKMMVKGPVEAEKAIFDVLSRIKKLDKHEQSAIIGSIFGNESGIKTAIATLSTQVDLLNKPFEIAGDSAKYLGSMTKEYEVRAATTSNQVAILNNSFKLMSAQLASSILPIFNELVKSLSGGIQKITSWIDENKELTKALLIGAGALITLNLAIGAVTFAFGTILKSIALLKPVLTVATIAVKLFNIALMANPIGAIILALTALGTTIYLIYKKFDVIKSYFLELWSAFERKFPLLAQGVKDVFNKIASYIAPFTNAVSTGFNYIKEKLNIFLDFFKTSFETLKNIYNTAVNNVINFKNSTINVFNSFADSVRGVFTSLKITYDNGINYIQSVFNSIATAITSSILNAMSFVENMANNSLNAVNQKFIDFKTFITTLWSDIWSFASDTVHTYLDPIVNFIDESLLYITNKFSSLKSSLSSGFDTVKNFFGFGDDEGNSTTYLQKTIEQNQIVQANTETKAQLPTQAPVFSIQQLASPKLNTPMPALAKGGIVTKPTVALVGEGAEHEAVLPLSQLETFVKNDNRTSNTSSSNNISVAFNPQITINGNSNVQELKTMLSELKRELLTETKSEFERLERDKKRLSYV